MKILHKIYNNQINTNVNTVSSKIWDTAQAIKLTLKSKSMPLFIRK